MQDKQAPGMLIISAGMQKSGSAWFYNVVNDLVTVSGSGIDARKLKKNCGLDGLMQWHNNNIGGLTPFKLYRLYRLSRKHGSFAVKTHAGPNLFTGYLTRNGQIRIIYSYRDPRDVLLSSMDFGNTLLQQGERHTFARMVDFDNALNEVRGWLHIWWQYHTMPGILTLRYEDIMTEPVEICRKIEDYLGTGITDEQRRTILWKYSRDNKDADHTGMHFNKAVIYRYRSEMDNEQLAACNDAFAEFLPAMGYSMD